jgi:hypothetical protein
MNHERRQAEITRERNIEAAGLRDQRDALLKKGREPADTRNSSVWTC